MSPLVLHPEDSFATAVELLSAAGVHRLYVVDGRKPVGVVALADVLRVIAAGFHRDDKATLSAAAAGEPSE
jgi:CBS domain-containing protein